MFAPQTFFKNKKMDRGIVTKRGALLQQIFSFALCLRWTLLPKECYGDWVSSRESNTQPSNWEADTFPLGYHSPSITQYQFFGCLTSVPSPRGPLVG